MLEPLRMRCLDRRRRGIFIETEQAQGSSSVGTASFQRGNCVAAMQLSNFTGSCFYKYLAPLEPLE